jgi:GntR family transcriptional regulator
MTRARKDEIVSLLRRRVLRAVAAGVLGPGDRLPGTRELSLELGADPRVVAAAYRTLAEEALVELRPRAGAFVASGVVSHRHVSAPPIDYIADVLAHASTRGFGATSLARAVTEVATGRRIRVVVLSATADQALGMARELEEEYGVDARAIRVDQLSGQAGASALRRSHLVVTTRPHAELARSISEERGIPHLIVTVRSNLFDGEWMLWRDQPVHVVVLDARFRKVVREFLRNGGASEAAVRVHLATDDLSRIGDDAPTYVTTAARAHLGRTRVPGQLIPPTRLFDEGCVRAIWREIGALRLRDAAER